MMPEGLLLTVPEPAPLRIVVRLTSLAVAVNSAVTEVGWVGLRTQFAVPLQPPPLQPEKTEPALALALNVTNEPETNPAEHWLLPLPQAIPAGSLVTTPPPLPPSTAVTDTILGSAIIARIPA